MARSPFKLPGVKKDPLMASTYSDKNFNKQIPMPLSSNLPSDRPNLYGPERPVVPEARKARFKRLAGILGGLKKS